MILKLPLLYFILLIIFPINSNASIIHESATFAYGDTGQTGEAVIGPVSVGFQFLGSRFSIDKTTTVDYVGGHLSPNYGDLFAAIVELESSTALPVGAPFDNDEVIASTTFIIPGSTSFDILIPLNVTLSPGNYALIFGSGLFGTSGYATMPLTNPDISGSASYFFWSGPENSWDYDGFSDARFVVTGTVVPIPAAVWLFGSGLIGLIGLARRKA